jgi:hypothetical protein
LQKRQGIRGLVGFRARIASERMEEKLMNKLWRNLLIATALAAAVALVFGFLGAVVHAEEVGNSGQWLAGALGILTFFILQMRADNRRAAPADAEARSRALNFACPQDRALVYFVRTGFAGKAVGMNVVIDGKTVVQLKSPRFTCLTLAPGMHELEARVGDGESALNPASARLSKPLAVGSVTLLHIAIQRGMLKSQLVFEPWTLDIARARLAKIAMVLPELSAASPPS